MGRVADAREHLAVVLEPVWPGRVWPYPPTRPTPTAGVYVATLSAGWGDQTTWTATFTVRLVADGADRAAHAVLDDLVDRVYDALAGSDHCYPGAVVWEPWPADDVTELPAYSFTVDVELAVFDVVPARPADRRHDPARPDWSLTMSDALRFKITDGVLAFSVVDTAALGYTDVWQAPGGVAVNVATLADYTDADAEWSCQVSTATIDASADTTTESVEATWCSPAKTTPNPGETSFTINATFFQDPHVDDGLWAFLYANDTAEAYFYMGLGGDAAPPAAIGRCRVTAATFGGAGQVSLTATLSCPVSRRYDAWVGAAGAGNSSIITADGTVTPVALNQTGAQSSPAEADAA